MMNTYKNLENDLVIEVANLQELQAIEKIADYLKGNGFSVSWDWDCMPSRKISIIKKVSD